MKLKPYRFFLFLMLAGLLVHCGPPSVQMREAHADALGDTKGVVFDHSDFNSLLGKHVDADGGVDYAGFAADRAILDRYLKTIAKASLADLNRDEKLAFFINAYNAYTLTLILNHDTSGKLASIMDIPKSKRWDAVRWNVAGEVLSLNQVEHQKIRPNFREPRIHFALVCAAVGCPPLRNEAYIGATLEAQLESQATYVHEHARWFGFDDVVGGGTVHLTKLYQWYGGDFEQVAGSVLAYAGRYSAALHKALGPPNGTSPKPKIQWLDYDWSLNRQKD